jgi:hypothetical protein
VDTLSPAVVAVISNGTSYHSASPTVLLVFSASSPKHDKKLSGPVNGNGIQVSLYWLGVDGGTSQRCGLCFAAKLKLEVRVWRTGRLLVLEFSDRLTAARVKICRLVRESAVESRSMKRVTMRETACFILAVALLPWLIS